MDRFPEADIGWQDYNSSLTQPLASMRVHDFGAVSDVDLYSRCAIILRAKHDRYGELNVIAFQHWTELKL